MYHNKHIDQVKKHTRYLSAQHQEFQVLHVTDNPDPWVHYQNTRTRQEYSCRLEAFEQRFKPIINYRYSL